VPSRQVYPCKNGVEERPSEAISTQEWGKKKGKENLVNVSFFRGRGGKEVKI